MLGRLAPLFGGAFLAAALVLGAGAATAATITESARAEGGVRLDLAGASACGASGGSLATNVGTFSGHGKAGSGGTACGDRSTPQVKTDATPHPGGRFNPMGSGWIDSNDLARITWDVTIGKAFRSVTFALTDANDQPNSFFRMVVDGAATWEIAERQPNGALTYLTVLFDAPVDAATIAFETRHNDGFGIADVSVQPVPVPPGLLLIGSGVAALAMARRRRARRAAA